MFRSNVFSPPTARQQFAARHTTIRRSSPSSDAAATRHNGE